MLRTRLIVGLLPLLLLFLVVGVYALRTSQELGESVESLFARNFRSIHAVQEMRDASTQLSLVLADVRQGGDLVAARSRFIEQRTRFRRTLNDELLAQPDPRKAAVLNHLDGQFQKYVAAANETLRLGSISGLELLKETESALFTVNRTLDQLLNRDREEIAQAESNMASRVDRSLQLLVAAMVGAVVLFFFLAWRLADSFVKPIQALTASAVALGAGDLDREVPVRGGGELGQLAKAFNAMAVHLRAYRDATLAKVLRTQRTMEATLTSTPEPVFVIDREGLHDQVRNPAAQQLAQSPDFAQGLPLSLAEPLAQVLATGTHYLPTDYARVVTFNVAREDRHYLPRILAIGDKLTEFKGAAIVLQDVTKFRLLDDAKTNLVGTVSHELKSPLTSLRMAIYLLLEQKIAGLTPTQQELLDTARDDADRLLRILDNLLDLARLEAGASSLDRNDVRVSDLIAGIAAEARGFVDPAGRKLVVEVEPELESQQVKVDSLRVRHVFINLLTNAVKYSPPDGVITLGAAAAPLGFVRFSVTNNGSGIPSEVLPHVFERFYRAPGQSQAGAGLGLAIAREIVVAHGGSITCTSEEGLGTTFAFLLPR